MIKMFQYKFKVKYFKIIKLKNNKILINKFLKQILMQIEFNLK